MAGAPPLGLCDQVAQDQAADMAQYDMVHFSATGQTHAYLADFGWSGFCGCDTEFGCGLGQGDSAGHSYDEAVYNFYRLGPGEGHYEGLVSTDNKCVACGHSTPMYGVNDDQLWYTFNWCLADPVPTAAPAQAGPSPAPASKPTAAPVSSEAVRCMHIA